MVFFDKINVQFLHVQKNYFTKLQRDIVIYIYCVSKFIYVFTKIYNIRNVKQSL